MESARDHRSLRRQIQEDDDAIELDDVEVDHGVGVSKWMDTEEPGPGFQRIPAAGSIRAAQTEFPEKIKVVDFEDVSDPDPSEGGSELSATPSARADAALEEEPGRDTTVPSAGADTVGGHTPSWGTSRTILQVSPTPSTPEEHRQFDDDNCPATRAEFRRMKKQLRETRLAVKQLLQKQWEDEQFLDAQTLLRVAQRGIQTIRHQLEQFRIEVDARL